MAANLQAQDLVHCDANTGNILVVHDATDTKDGSSTEGVTSADGVRVVFVDTESMGRGSVLLDACTVLLEMVRIGGPEAVATEAYQMVVEYILAVASEQPLHLQLALAARITLLLFYATWSAAPELECVTNTCRTVFETLRDRCTV